MKEDAQKDPEVYTEAVHARRLINQVDAIACWACFLFFCSVLIIDHGMETIREFDALFDEIHF